MNEKEVKISYDTTAEDALDIAFTILDDLGVAYEVCGDEIITIKYQVPESKPKAL